MGPPFLCDALQYMSLRGGTQSRRGNLLVPFIDQLCRNKHRTGRFLRSLRSLGMTNPVDCKKTE